MIIRYKQHKDKMTINSPIGSGNKKVKSKIHFSPGSTYDFTEEEGCKLLDLDSHNFEMIISGDPVKSDKVVKKRGRKKKVDHEHTVNI